MVKKWGDERHNRHRPRAIIHAKPGHLDVDVVVDVVVVVVVADVPWLWESWEMVNSLVFYRLCINPRVSPYFEFFSGSTFYYQNHPHFPLSLPYLSGS
jgi:hypothetical protein